MRFLHSLFFLFFYTFLLFFSCVNVFAQQKIISGTVQDPNNDITVIGAIVAYKTFNNKNNNTSSEAEVSTKTDREGAFTLTLTTLQLSEGYLTVTYKTYKPKTVKINNRTYLTINLPVITDHSEVIVTSSYTKRRKEEVVGSITTLTSNELQTVRPIESFDKMLEGLAAGVQVETNTELGTPVKINIRGQNALSPVRTSNSTALTASSQPLYIIDGVPIVEQRRGDEPIAFLNNEQLLNPLAGINPDDIESISILKDAAAASIYGANASNGVVIITTKKGKAGKTRFNVGYSSGISQPFNAIKWLSGQQYQGLLKELYVNEGRDPAAAELLAGPTDINTDWYNLLNRRGSFNNIDLDLSGGSENSQYRIAASYLKQQSIQKGNDYEKFYIRIRLDNTLHKKLKMGISLAPTITKKNALDAYGIVPLIPNVPAYDFDGTFYEPTRLGVPNPLAVLAQNTAIHEGGSLNGNLTFNYTPITNLTVTSSFGTDMLINKLNLFDSPKNATGRTKNGFAQIYDRLNFNWINFNQATYKPVFTNKKHNADITAGIELQSQYAKLLRGTGTGFTYYRLNELSNASNQTAASSKQKSTSVAYFGQAQYSYNNTYFVNASARYDAASIFGNDVNSTVNQAIGLGINLAELAVLKNQKNLTQLRLRGSYGTTGNSRISSYEARGLYNFDSDPYNGNTSSQPVSLPNPNLSWEKSTKLNTGIDIGLYSKFDLSIDYYQNTIKNCISLIDIPAQTGFNNYLANVADMRNSGVDIALKTTINIGTVKWNAALNAGFNKNKIIRVNNNSSIYSTNENATAVKAGASTSAIWGFAFAGVNPTTGVEEYYDANKNRIPVTTLNNSITNATNLGDRLPKLQGGFINNFTYKSLTIGINLIYNLGSYRLINYRNEWNGRNLDNRNQSINLLDRWQKPGDITNVPKLSRTTRFIPNSSRYLYEDTYLKLSNVTIGYTVPKKYSKYIGGMRSQVFVNGTNLWYWYKQQSPTGRNGVAEYKFNFPEAQSFTFGLKAGI